MGSELLKVIKEKRLYFDGGTGTVLQSWGLNAGTPPEVWNLSRPDKVQELHSAYINAGCNIIKTNTFGVNSLKYGNHDEYVSAACSIAKQAAGGRDNVFVAFDIGPLGRLLESLGDLSFEDAVSAFADGVKVAVKCGIDLILVETMNDSYETKAAVLAAKENSDLPVFVTNVYDEGGSLMTGANPAAMVAMLEGLGVDALGINCSLGPDIMLGIIPEFVKNASVPIIVNPNAGLPAVRCGQTVYSIDSDAFAEYMAKIAELGGCILGGCCGTTPEYIEKIIEKTKDIAYRVPSYKERTVVSSYTHAVAIGGEPVLIGERINPTGKPKLKEALRSGNMSYVVNEGVRQSEEGVHILDVNVGLPEIDEGEMMVRTVRALQTASDLPLQLDSSDPVVLERAMRIYNGKPLINSVNGEQKSMNAIFPLVKKYGGAVIALTIDGGGIPVTAEKRAEIAAKITECAGSYGVGKKDIIVDPLALTISSDPGSAAVTLKAVELVKAMGLKASLGVSNISFGLPARDKINASFFSAALEKGLDCAIINPFSERMMDTYRAHRVLHGLDEGCAEYIAYAESANQRHAPATESAKSGQKVSDDDLKRFIVLGLKNPAVGAAKLLLKSDEPLKIISERIIPALDEIGAAYENKKAYLPQLLMSAEAAAAAFGELKAAMPKGDAKDGREIILATVKGDIHDIGKNIVRVLLESYGFTVLDLGRDVPPEKVLECVKATGCRIVGLSALMTTTVPSMAETIELVHSLEKDIKVVVGGAVLNQEYADMIGADFYAADGMDTVRFAESFYKDGGR